MSDKVSSGATTSERNQILMDSVGLHEGETSYKLVCPRCKRGGSSFGVTRNNNTILFKCHRASCGIAGSIHSTLYDNKSNVIPFNKSDSEGVIKFNPTPFKGTLTTVPESVIEMLRTKYEFHPAEVEDNGLMYDGVNQRLAMPIYDYYGRRKGYQLKKLPNSDWKGAKVISYWEIDDKVKLHFPPVSVKEDSTVVITEGILDAIKVSPLWRSCALMGTHMSDKQAAFLATHFTKAIIALDPDALGKAQTILHRYSHLFDRLVVRYLNQDPKDTTYNRLETVLTI